MNTFVLIVFCFWLPASVLAAPVVGKLIKWSA